jgi:hypothetical protein
MVKMGIRAHRDWWPGNRRYYLKASEIYAKVMKQSGFAACGGHRIRAALREHLVGRIYFSPPGQMHNPAADEQSIFGDRVCPNELSMRSEGWRGVNRYSYERIMAVATRLPFRCPICAGEENPLARWEHQLPYADDEQLICQRCWKGYAVGIDALLDKIEALVKKLNKGIENAQRRKRTAATSAGDQAA